MPPASPGAWADSARTRASIFRLPSLAAETPWLWGVQSWAQGTRASSRTGRESSRTVTLAVQAGLASAALAHVVRAGGWAGGGRSLWAEAATSKSSASWGQLWRGHRLRGLRGHRLTSSHPESGRDTYPPGSDWTRGQDSGGPPGGAFLWLEA